LPFLLQEILAEYMDLPMSKVRVIKPHFGGGFGSKLEMLAEHICALLSRMTGRPVKLVFTRKEEFTATVSRHADIIKLKVGVGKDGTLSAIQAHLISNEGAYMVKPGPSGLAGRGLTRTYRCPNTRYVGQRVYTNLISGGAFRGYGNLQAHFAVESMMDIISDKLGIDPVEFKLQNYKRQGDMSFAELPITSSGLTECLARGREWIGWEKREKPGSNAGMKKRGIGMACCMHGSGSSFTQPDFSSASIRINSDGTAHLVIGTADLGTGSTTTLTQIAAEELGISPEAIEVVSGDTGTISFDSGIFASRALYTVGNAVKAAAADAKRKILLRAAEKLEVGPEDLEFKEGRIYIRATPDKGLALIEFLREISRSKRGATVFVGEASHENMEHPPSFGAHFAEVEVDTETGQVEVLRVVAFQDNGKSINPMVVEGQTEGALAQSIGFALTENPIIDRETGEMLNPDFANYMVLTALDMPSIEVGLVETYEPTGPFGAKGMSELPISGTAPAIANAIYNATGVRLFDVPMIQEKVFKALKASQGSIT
jgi:xanthine dehydrogenase molybdenum-binding subunit